MSVRRRLKNAFVPERIRHQISPLRQRVGATQGTPTGLDREYLDAVVEEVYGVRPRSVMYSPILGGERDTVHRLWLTLGPGRFRTLVFKNAQFVEDECPATRGSPGRAVSPEWSVMSQNSTPLTAYLPAVHAAAEVDPGRRYHYLLDDLAWSFRRVLSEQDVAEAVAGLKGVHGALAAWGEQHGYQPRSRFGADDAEAFLTSVEGALGPVASAGGGDVTRAFLARWDEVKAQYLSVDTVVRVSPQLIHGDYHHGNTFVDAADVSRIKLVDWECMGNGPPHADLASVLQRSPWGRQRAAIREFFSGDHALSHEDHWDVYLWCRLGRSLLDAALHAQRNPAHNGQTPAAVEEHLYRAADVLAAMTRTPVWSFADAQEARGGHVGKGSSTSPRVTIGLPVRNGAEFLEETIESILSQTFEDFALIISDNASTDATPDIVAAFAARDPRVRSQRRAENVGARDNYNGLVEGVETEFFKWAAHDDLYAPDHLEQCVATLDAHPDAVLAFPQAVDIDCEGNFIEDQPFDSDVAASTPVERFRSYQGARKKCFPVFGLCRTQLLQRSGLIGDYAGCDRVLLAELLLYGTWREIPEPLFFHREHEDRSVRKHNDPRQRASWFVPHRSGPDAFNWKAFHGYRRAIARAPVSAGERAALSGLLAKWAVLSAPSLAGDLVAIRRGGERRCGSPMLIELMSVVLGR